MKYSSRLDWDAPPNPISQAVAARRASGDGLIDLTESNPTRCGFTYPPEVLAALANPASLVYEPDSRGLLSARQAVARYAGVDVDRVLLTASTSEAYSYLFKLLCHPGDEVLVPRPSYPLFEFLSRLDGVRVVPYPLFYDDGWHIDTGRLHELVTPATSAIVTVNPNNPTGSYLSFTELDELERIGLPVISDEVFADFPFTPDSGPPRRVTCVARNSNVLSFSLSGLSKLCGLPQMKLGWMILGGDGWRSAMDRLELIADTYLSVNTPVQQALPVLLETRIDKQILERVRGNRALIPGALKADGGWNAVVRVPDVHTEEEWALQLIREQGVLVQPGYFYDFESEAFLILSLLCRPEEFREALRRVRLPHPDFGC